MEKKEKDCSKMQMGLFKGMKAVANGFVKINKRCNLLCVLFVIITTGTISMGQDYYVDPVNGNNNNPGTSASPWQSFLRATPTYSATPAVAEGDTVYLAAGNYGSVDYNRSEVTSRTQWITYKALS